MTLIEVTISRRLGREGGPSDVRPAFQQPV